jgi:hypothetical protein
VVNQLVNQLAVQQHASGQLTGRATGQAAEAAAGAVLGVAAGVAGSRERTVELLGAFAELVPGGVLQRGTTVGCAGSAAMSLAMAVAAGPVGQGAWVGVAGVPTFGMSAAVELGIAAQRLVLVNQPPGGFGEGQWADVVAAMIDGFDVVVLGAGVRGVRPAIARRLQARVQTRGAILITVGALDGFGCDLQFVAGRPVWEGLGDGHGIATARRVEVELRGRRMSRPRRASMWLPDAAGRLATGRLATGRLTTAEGVEELPTTTPIPLRRTG